jgi:hypothetical protein
MYVRDSNVVLNLEIVTNGYLGDGNVWVRSQGGLINFSTPAMVDGDGNVTVNGTAVVDSVHHYDNLELTWEYRVGTEGNWSEWKTLGSTSNDVYVVLGPTVTSDVFHTVVHLGSVVPGATSYNQQIENVWSHFSGKAVKNVEGRNLYYYSSYVTQSTSTLELLRTRDGTCDAWVNLFLDVLRIHLIDRPDADVRVRSGFYYESMMINDWTFNGNGIADAAIVREANSEIDNLIYSHPYLNLKVKVSDSVWGVFHASGTAYTWEFNDVSDADGLQGQNRPNPASLFQYHRLVQFNTGNGMKWYDPSYGVEYVGADQTAREMSFDVNAVAGFYVTRMAKIRESIVQRDLNGDGDTHDDVDWEVLLIRKNPPDTNPDIERF